MSKTKFEVDKKNLEVRSERVYAASAARLFRAYTDPAEIPQWWGPAYLTTTVDKLELRVGGSWRFISREAGGKEHIFSGVYRQIDEPNKLVDTFEYEAVPGHVLLETITFTPQEDGKTKVMSVSKYDNVGDLEGMVNMDMEVGVIEGNDRLAKLVE